MKSKSLLLAFVPAALTVAFESTAAEPARAVSAADLAACYDAQRRVLPFSGVMLAQRERQSLFRASGSPDPAAPSAYRRDTRFRLASVGKIFTRVAIGRLVDQHKVELDAPIGTYLKALPPEIAAVTIRQLLEHRSGVASFTRPSPEDMRILTSARTASDLLPLVANKPLAFRPGEREQYSNGGFFLLGAVVEAVTGRPYDRYYRDSIFHPLDMASTSYDPDARTAVPATRMAGPGRPPLARPRPIPEAMIWRGNPAGDAISTVDDLMKLGRALLGEKLLSPATRLAVFPHPGGVWKIGQAGGNLGSNTDFSVFPEKGWVLVVLSNYDPPAGEAMAEVLDSLVAGKGCHTVTEEQHPSPFQAPPAPSPPVPAGAPSAAGAPGAGKIRPDAG